MKRFLSILLLLFVIVAGVATALLSDANVQRLTEYLISNGLERELRIDGEFSFKFGSPLRVVAKSVRLANPVWADNTTMLELERVDVAINPWTILGNQPLIIEDLQITRLEGELVRDEAGRVNWEFGGDSDRGGVHFLLREWGLNETVVTMRRPGYDPVTLDIEFLRQEEAMDGLLRITLAGALNGRAISADGRLGPFQNLMQGKNVQIAMTAAFGHMDLNVSGLLDDLASPRQPTLWIELVAPSAVDVAEMFGVEHPIQGDVKLRLEAAPAGPGIGLKAEGHWGSTRVDAQGRIADLPSLDGVELQASVAGNNLRDALQMLGFQGLPVMPFGLTGDFTRDGSNLSIRELLFGAGDYLFEMQGDMRGFPSLNDATLKLQVKGPDLARLSETFRLPSFAGGDFSVQGELDRGADGRDRFLLEAETELGKAGFSGTLGPAPDYEGSRAVFRATGLSLRRLGEPAGLQGLPERPFKLEAEIERLADGYRLVDEATLVAGETSLTIAGVLGTQPLEQGTELAWRLVGLDIAELLAATGLSEAFPSRQSNASGNLRVGPAAIVLDAVEGTLDSAEFTLEGKLVRTRAMLGSDIRFAIRGPELQRLNVLVGDFKLPAGEFSASGRIERTTKGLSVSESQINLAGARGRLDGELALPADPLQLGFDVALEGPDAAGFWKDHIDLGLASLPFQLNARGTLDDQNWQIDNALIRVGANEVTLSGGAQRTPSSSVLQVRVESPNVSELGAWYGLELPNTSLQLTATLEQDAKVLRLNDFLASTDKGDVSGNLSYTSGMPPTVEARLNSTGFDLSGWVEMPEQRPSDAGERSSDARVIPDWPLPLDVLKQLNAEVSVQADSITLQRQTRTHVDLKLVLEDGALNLAPLSFSGDAGSLDLELSLEPLTVGADLSLSLIAENLYSGLFLSGLDGLNGAPRGNWNFQLRSDGSTLRELIHNLNGIGKLKTFGGRVPNSRGQSLLFGPLFSNVIRAVNPFYESEPYTEIVCSVLPFTFADGLMISAPTAVMQTDKLNILSSGRIDLRTEELELEFRTEARQGLGITAANVVNPFIRIGGTLAAPAVNVDRRRALVTGGAAFFTGGLSLLAQAALGGAFRSSDPCESVLAESKKYFANETGR